MKTTRKTVGKTAHGRAPRALTTALVLTLLAALLLAGTALAAAKPGRPTAKAPTGTVTIATPSFKWSKAKGASKYELRVYQGKKVALKKTGLKKTTWTAVKALPENVSLTWKVRGSNARGAGAWSKSLTFKIVPPSPATPDLTGLALSGSPANYAFAPATYAYSGVTVLNAVGSVTVTPTGSGAITVEGTPVASGSPSAAIALTTGTAKTITVIATETGKSAKIYSVAVTRNSALLAMVSVPAGTFQRDATATNTSSVSALSMSEKEITVDQFTAVTGLANPSTDFTGVVNGPVQKANWYHALVFCNKLSMREGRTPVYAIGGSTDPAAWIAANGGIVPVTSNTTWDAAILNWAATGYRLPTEMEWEWAAMGATSDARSGDIVGGVNTGGYTKGYAGSTEAAGAQVDIGLKAWYRDNAGSTTHTAGTRAANELGLYDMTGNVMEWCWDWWGDSYPDGTLADYPGPVSGTFRVLRGDSWSGSYISCPVAYRVNLPPLGRWNSGGFRVVRP